jgi:uncharacterized YigZ family protein
MFTIKNNSNTKIQIKGSIFICNLLYLEKLEDVKSIINKISDEYKDATHNCYAYRLGINNIIEYSSDDGEPSGSAGKPILNTLRKYNLTNIISIVTRYFGGSKLGIRGLIDAYSESTENTIKISELIQVFEKKYFSIECDYNLFEIIKNRLNKFDAVIENINYTSIVKLLIYTKKENSSLLEDFFKQERIYYNAVKS